MVTDIYRRSAAQVIQNHENVNVRNIGQGDARHRKYKRLKLGGGQAYDPMAGWFYVVRMRELNFDSPQLRHSYREYSY
jgi:hypothetical protein